MRRSFAQGVERALSTPTYLKVGYLAISRKDIRADRPLRVASRAIDAA
jgi:hypothetical protein